MSRVPFEQAGVFQFGRGWACCRRLIGPSALNAAGSAPCKWDPDAPLTVPGKELKVQPVLMYCVQEHRDETSYRFLGKDQ